MAWMNEARTRLATRPYELLPDARSLVVVGVSYRTEEPERGPGRIARYAWGSDYHDALKRRLQQLAAFLGGRARASSSIAARSPNATPPCAPGSAFAARTPTCSPRSARSCSWGRS